MYSTENVSKRSVLSLSSKLYDPLGFVEPVTVKAKIMVQELWKHNLKWDKELQQQQQQQQQQALLPNRKRKKLNFTI